MINKEKLQQALKDPESKGELEKLLLEKVQTMYALYTNSPKTFTDELIQLIENDLECIEAVNFINGYGSNLHPVFQNIFNNQFTWRQ